MNKKIKNRDLFSWIYLILPLALLGIILYQSVLYNSKEITQDDFFEKLKAKEVERILVHQRERVSVVLKKKISQEENKLDRLTNSSRINYNFEIGDLRLFQEKIEKYKEKYQLNDIRLDFKNREEGFFSLFKGFGTLILIGFGFLAFWIYLMRKMGAGGGGPASHIFNIGKSRAKLFNENDNVKITFKDVAGLEGPKEEVQEIVEFLKKPDKYTKLGGKIPKGALLIGPPGTGKTLLAKAVAGEAKVPFFSLSGSDFVEMFVGVGASRVRDLFEKAKAKSPCIIFIDEIDAIGRARGKSNITSANDERENTLNQLLTEMDGFSTHTHVIVIAATNRVDILDKALLRPGRFDRNISIDLPELNERKGIFEVHLKKLILSTNVEVDFLARQTPGFSGADISNICNEAALIAARKDKHQVERQDFLDAIDRIIGGLEKKNKIIKPNEKKRIAYHEAGHATISWMIEHAAPLVKVTIVPRGRSLGAAWYLPEERQITTLDQMNDEICALFGGRAAEEIIFGNVSTGALSDLERITKQAQSMVLYFGLSSLGNVSYYDSSNGGELAFNKPYSEKTAHLIDEEISKIIEFQYKRAKEILKENKDKLVLLAERLLEKEVIFREDLENIFGSRAFVDEIGEMIKYSQDTNKESKSSIK